MSADLPFEPKNVNNIATLTTETLAVGKSLGEFWPHVDVKVLAHLNFHLSGFHTFINHGLDAIRVQCVEYIADPLLVNMYPVSRIRQKSEHWRSFFRIFEEVCYSEAFNLRY